MATISVRYGFRQRLRVPARAAYRWCTDFGPDDGPLFSHPTQRTVERIAEDAVILTDTTRPDGRRRRIRRLVRMNPALMAWTNTHLDGPYRHSQFWYRIVPDGPRRCHLEFEGLKLESEPTPLSASEAARRARANRASDAGEWRRFLAPALESDLRPPRRR